MIEKRRKVDGDVRKIVERVLTLGAEVRMDFFDEIMGLLAEEDPASSLNSPEWHAEISRRAREAVEAIESGDPGVSADELIAQLRAKHKA